MEARQASDGGGVVPGAAWWPVRSLPSLWSIYRGTWTVTVGNYQDCGPEFIHNFGAVTDDFGNLVRVE